MKSKNYILSLMVFSVLASFSMNYFAQTGDCEIHREHWETDDQIWNLNIGESVVVHLDNEFFNAHDDNPGWRFNNDDAALIIKSLEQIENYPSYEVYSEHESESIGGTGQLVGQNVRFSCVSKCFSEDCLPQPKAWIPLDVGDSTPGRKLVLKRAYIYENSEDLGCPHGPWGSIGLKVFPAELVDAYPYYMDLRDDYCEGNNPACLDQMGFLPISGGLASNHTTSGPIHSSTNDCSSNNSWLWDDVVDFLLPGTPAQDVLSYFLENPNREWIDGVWGMNYSNNPVVIWDSISEDQVSIVLREGDDTNSDDFLGMINVSEDMEGEILFKAWNFGWLVFENIETPETELLKDDMGLEYTKYWMSSWNGAVFHKNLINTEGKVYNNHGEGEIHYNSMAEYQTLVNSNSNLATPGTDQYVPLPRMTLDDAQQIFNENDRIGLLGSWCGPADTIWLPGEYSAITNNVVFENVRKTASLGGSGGKVFWEMIPHHFDYNDSLIYPTLNSIKVWSGSRVDGISLKYTGRGGFEKEIYLGQPGGDANATFVIPPNESITGVNLKAGSRINNIQFILSNGTLSPEYGGNGGQPYTLNVPGSYLFRGFFGRDGDEIDQIGIIYSN